MSDPITTIMTIALGVAGALCLLLAQFGESSADWLWRRAEDKRMKREALEWVTEKYRAEKERRYELAIPRDEADRIRLINQCYDKWQYERRNDG